MRNPRSARQASQGIRWHTTLGDEMVQTMLSVHPARHMGQNDKILLVFRKNRKQNNLPTVLLMEGSKCIKIKLTINRLELCYLNQRCILESAGKHFKNNIPSPSSWVNWIITSGSELKIIYILKNPGKLFGMYTLKTTSVEDGTSLVLLDNHIGRQKAKIYVLASIYLPLKWDTNSTHQVLK